VSAEAALPERAEEPAASPEPGAGAATGLRSSFAPTGLLILAFGYTLYFAANLLLPIATAVLASLILEPIVKALRRWRVPAGLGALLVLLGLLGGAGYGIWALATPAAEWLERAPAAAREVERKIHFVREPLTRVSEASAEVEKATALSSAPPARAVVVQPPSMLAGLLDRTQRFAAGALVAVILLYFLLANPDGLLEKLVSLAPALTDKKRVVATVRRIEDDVSRYLLTISAINAGLGVAVGLVLYALDVPNPALWGVLAAAANFVPYAGAVGMAAVITAVGVLSFDEPSRMFAPALAFATLTVLEAYLVTPIVLGRRLTLSPIAVFLSVVVWSWLWGIPGALLAVPMLAAAKIVSQQVPALAPVARLLD
jgi:predicted PurR-regulated permease PerM